MCLEKIVIVGGIVVVEVFCTFRFVAGPIAIRCVACVIVIAEEEMFLLSFVMLYSFLSTVLSSSQVTVVPSLPVLRLGTCTYLRSASVCVSRQWDVVLSMPPSAMKTCVSASFRSVGQWSTSLSTISLYVVVPLSIPDVCLTALWLWMQLCFDGQRRLG